MYISIKTVNKNSPTEIKLPVLFHATVPMKHGATISLFRDGAWWVKRNI